MPWFLPIKNNNNKEKQRSICKLHLQIDLQCLVKYTEAPKKHIPQVFGETLYVDCKTKYFRN